MSERLYVLRYAGRIAGRFPSQDAALDEVERLSRLAVKRGYLPGSFEIWKE